MLSANDEEWLVEIRMVFPEFLLLDFSKNNQNRLQKNSNKSFWNFICSKRFSPILLFVKSTLEHLGYPTKQSLIIECMHRKKLRTLFCKHIWIYSMRWSLFYSLLKQKLCLCVMSCCQIQIASQKGSSSSPVTLPSACKNRERFVEEIRSVLQTVCECVVCRRYRFISACSFFSWIILISLSSRWALR